MSHPKTKTTGVIQPLPGIGDTIWLLPALQALATHAPDKKLTLFTKASSLANKVLADETWVAGIFYLPKGRGLVAIIPNFIRTWWVLIKNRPDRLYVLHQSLRYRLAAKLAGIQEVVAYPSSLAKSKMYGWKKSLTFLEQLKIPITNSHTHLNLRPERIVKIRQKFKSYPEPWFVVAPGSSELNRCWPEDRFAACADHLSDAFGGTVFLTGALNEAERISAVHVLCRNKNKIIEAVAMPFDEFIALIACCKAVLGNDSGPINIAAALGIPAFVLCGITAPALHSPHLIVIKPDQPKGNGNGMERISTQQVLKTITSHLSPQIEILG